MAIHPWILHNGRICKAGTAELRAGQIGLLSGWGIFTTLRISAGVPFAWERHWARMQRDARLMNVPMPPDPAVLELDLIRLAEANGQSECTMRFVVVRNSGGMWEEAGNQPVDVIAMTATSKHWGDSAKLGVQPMARFAGNEFAGAKILSWGQNLTWAERAIAAGFDEIVLMNQHGFIAECTSANIFAGFDGQVVTPPLRDGCLAGITREVLLNEVRVPGIEVVERSISIDDLFCADEVFITSTTRDLLPVSTVDRRPVAAIGTARERLLPALRDFIRRDVEQRRAALNLTPV
jgi:branched-chain amino acid aminotransferase